jgi:hypothetical protein
MAPYPLRILYWGSPWRGDGLGGMVPYPLRISHTVFVSTVPATRCGTNWLAGGATLDEGLWLVSLVLFVLVVAPFLRDGESVFLLAAHRHGRHRAFVDFRTLWRSLPLGGVCVCVCVCVYVYFIQVNIFMHTAAVTAAAATR